MVHSATSALAKLGYGALNSISFAYSLEKSKKLNISSDKQITLGVTLDPIIPILSSLRLLRDRCIIYMDVFATAGTLKDGANMAVAEGLKFSSDNSSHDVTAQ